MQSTSHACEKKLNFLLVGKKAVGKSSSGNSILGRKAFTPLDTTMAFSCQRDDVRIKVTDTPGLMDDDESRNVKTITQVLPNIMADCPEGFDALLLVLKYGGGFTVDQAQTLYILKSMFGDNVVKDHCVVILTNGENFDLEQEDADEPHTFRDWRKLQKGGLGRLFKECQERVVLFYNLGKSDEMVKKRDDSVRTMMHKAFEMVKHGRYTSEHFKQCAEQRDHLIKTYGQLQVIGDTMKI